MTQLFRSNMLRKLAGVATVVLTAALGAPGVALAQQFEKVEGAPRAEMAASPFVAGAYGFIWIAILVYVVVVARGIARVDREVADLQRKIDAGGAGPGPRP
jgi:CcmD family protein